MLKLPGVLPGAVAPPGIEQECLEATVKYKPQSAKKKEKMGNYFKITNTSASQVHSESVSTPLNFMSFIPGSGPLHEGIDARTQHT